VGAAATGPNTNNLLAGRVVIDTIFRVVIDTIFDNGFE